jgi:fucose permease
MHLSFLFSGAGTLLLGPTLPVFAQHWHLRDSQSGLLIAAQFFGLFLGAIALSRNLRLTLLCGYFTAAAALVLLAIASNHAAGKLPGTFALFLLGLGLGQVTTTVNLLSALRFHAPQQRSAALSLLNFTWSAGAVLSPLVAGFYLAHISLFSLFLTFVAFAGVLFVALIVSTSGTVAPQPPEPAKAESRVDMQFAPLAYFFLLLLLYGGLEATVGDWLSTYTLRYTPLGIAAAAYCTSALWAAFAAGRALASVALRTLPERTVRTGGILLALLAIVALRSIHTGLSVGICASMIGLGIAPFFPVTFSLLIAHHPSPRQAGAATSNIGLGSAIFGYLTGIISTRAGSLHTAMLTPIVIAIGLLALCSVQPAGGE